MNALKTAEWVNADDRKKFARYGRAAAKHYLKQTEETLLPSMFAAVEATSPFDGGTGAAKEIAKAAFRHLRKLAEVA